MEQFVSWLPAIVSSVAAIYVYGRLTEKVSNNDRRLNLHEEKLEDHGTRLTKLDAWHEGFTAGTHRS